MRPNQPIFMSYFNAVNMNKRKAYDSFYPGCYESPMVEIAELDVEGVLCDSNTPQKEVDNTINELKYAGFSNEKTI